MVQATRGQLSPIAAAHLGPSRLQLQAPPGLTEPNSPLLVTPLWRVQDICTCENIERLMDAKGRSSQGFAQGKTQVHSFHSSQQMHKTPVSSVAQTLVNSHQNLAGRVRGYSWFQVVPLANPQGLVRSDLAQSYHYIYRTIYPVSVLYRNLYALFSTELGYHCVRRRFPFLFQNAIGPFRPL